MTRKSSFAPVASPATRLLVCGSLPGERSLEERRYYAHPTNQFWRLLSPVVGHDLTHLNYADRLAALLSARIGLWDVVSTAIRSGSSDSAIRAPTANDLAALLVGLPELRAIAFNGSKPAAIGRKLLVSTGLSLVDLPSSSAANTIGIAAKQPAWSALATYL